MLDVSRSTVYKLLRQNEFRWIQLEGGGYRLSLIHIQMCIRDSAGIEPETAFEDIPDDWTCPICGLGKDVFVPVEDLSLIHI